MTDTPDTPPQSASPASDPAPPPAATVAVQGTRDERTVQLEQELRKLQTRFSELEDHHRRYRDAVEAERSHLARRKAREDKLTFFDDDDEPSA